ncbi:MAG TPA: hypothetical protein VK179_09535 [Bacteroidales bacterium]|nr:hypothetical protein [Bacteroidales bacterium]
MVNKSLYFMALLAMVVFGCEKNDDNSISKSFVSATVAMGSNSSNDIYYSLANGVASSVERSTWDIAFSVPLQTATVLINEGAGVELYSVGDTNDWDAVNEASTTGRSKLFNDKSDWSNGAFNRTATGFPNYGWGTYHANTDHNVGGDSVYVIKLSDSSMKKFMIRAKLGATSSNLFRWADLDGGNEQVASLPTTPYDNKKHFIHYSLVDNQVVEAEPDMDSWDLLFTRYVVKIPAGPGQFMDYPVMGVLSNPDVKVAKVTGDPEKVNDTGATFSDAADVIGYDWKVSDPVTHEISIADSTSYFIQSVDGHTWQLYFTGYGGNTAGTIDIKIKKVD